MINPEDHLGLAYTVAGKLHKRLGYPKFIDYDECLSICLEKLVVASKEFREEREAKFSTFYFRVAFNSARQLLFEKTYKAKSSRGIANLFDEFNSRVYLHSLSVRDGTETISEDATESILHFKDEEPTLKHALLECDLSVDELIKLIIKDYMDYLVCKRQYTVNRVKRVYRIFKCRFKDVLTLQEIADKFNSTREGIRQILERSMRRTYAKHFKYHERIAL